MAIARIRPGVGGIVESPSHEFRQSVQERRELKIPQRRFQRLNVRRCVTDVSDPKVTRDPGGGLRADGIAQRPHDIDNRLARPGPQIQNNLAADVALQGPDIVLHHIIDENKITTRRAILEDIDGRPGSNQTQNIERMPV